MQDPVTQTPTSEPAAAGAQAAQAATDVAPSVPPTGEVFEWSELLDPAALSERAQGLWGEAMEIWLAGGWAMLAIASIAFLMFALGINIRQKLRRKGFLSVPEKVWRRWIDHPQERRGPIGDLLDFVTGSDSLEDTALFFDQLRMTELRPFERDLRVMKVFVSSAPLVGLLGTVTGMLTTFGALATGSGGDQTMGMIAGGISEALITTETGLVIALPGLFFQYQLARTFDRYKTFLAHLEAICTQTVYRRNLRKQRSAAA